MKLSAKIEVVVLSNGAFRPDWWTHKHGDDNQNQPTRQKFQKTFHFGLHGTQMSSWMQIESYFSSSERLL
jgi:hypothetical protein